MVFLAPEFPVPGQDGKKKAGYIMESTSSQRDTCVPDAEPCFVNHIVPRVAGCSFG